MVPFGSWSFVVKFPLTGTFVSVTPKSGLIRFTLMTGAGITIISKVFIAHIGIVLPSQALYINTTGPLNPGAGVNV